MDKKARGGRCVSGEGLACDTQHVVTEHRGEGCCMAKPPCCTLQGVAPDNMTREHSFTRDRGETCNKVRKSSLRTRACQQRNPTHFLHVSEPVAGHSQLFIWSCGTWTSDSIDSLRRLAKLVFRKTENVTCLGIQCQRPATQATSRLKG